MNEKNHITILETQTPPQRMKPNALSIPNSLLE